MIVVIADDLSGAAELAGVAVGCGLTAEVQTRFSPETSSRVVCLDTEGRALPAAAAAADAESVYRAVADSRPEWIFLKFDSVLRGNIARQLIATLEAGGQARAVLITANPRRGRTISHGEYLISGTPLHQTEFADDPVYPCTTSSVRALLGSEDSRILTPDVGSTADLGAWAGRVGAETLAAGSAEFFEALLKARISQGAKAGPQAVLRQEGSAPERPTLLVCGSRASWERRVREAEVRGVAAYDIMDDVAKAARTLESDGSILIGIGERIPAHTATPSRLLEELGDRVAKLCARVLPSTLMLEGGATAAVVMRRMGWTRLICEEGAGGGVGTLRPTGDGPLVLIKPGSYPWPADLWWPAPPRKGLYCQLPGSGPE